ncbi:hypothetical protein KSF73_17155 [Burkholderiaceae bacterium DAT-1]|nr:hypothetical protein [Burkholderiaceae bacterium DAT-1]
MNADSSWRLPTPYFEILIEDGLDSFTVVELRDAALKKAEIQGATPGEARRSAYKLVQQLTRQGLLIRSKVKGSYARFSKSELFKTALFQKVRGRGRLAQSGAVDRSRPKAAGEKKEIALHLEERVRHYRVDMLSSIGESEEYLRLYEQFPTLESQIEPLYMKAREKSSKLLGQIRALETVLETSLRHAS